MISSAATYRGQNHGFVRVVLLAILAMIMLAIGIAAVPGMHAVIQHGDDAVKIRDCIQKNGAYQIWKNKDGTFYQICQLPDKRYGIQVVVKAVGEWIEKTAFVKGDGGLSETLQYLAKFATKTTIIP